MASNLDNLAEPTDVLRFLKRRTPANWQHDRNLTRTTKRAVTLRGTNGVVVRIPAGTELVVFRQNAKYVSRVQAATTMASFFTMPAREREHIINVSPSGEISLARCRKTRPAPRTSRRQYLATHS